MRRLLKEPILQFFIGGLLLYIVVASVAPNGAVKDPRTIQINNDTLLSYLQYQSKNFQGNLSLAAISALSSQKYDQLEIDFVRDEVLFREAMALGLDENDEIIRRRLIQKMEYISNGFSNQNIRISEQGLKAFFETNKKDYLIEASVTFTHVFLDDRKNDGVDLATKGQAVLAELIQKKVPFEEAGRFGDRFLYHRNYVDRTPDFISSHFGGDFSDVVFSSIPKGKWFGPVISTYGSHLIYLTQKTTARTPSLEEVAPMVLADAQREAQRKASRDGVAKLISKYNLARDASSE